MTETKKFSEIIKENRESVHEEIMKAFKDQIGLQEQGTVYNVIIFEDGTIETIWLQTELETPVVVHNGEAESICKIKPDDVTYWIEGDNAEKTIDEYSDEEIEELKSEYWSEYALYRKDEADEMIDEAINRIETIEIEREQHWEYQNRQ